MYLDHFLIVLLFMYAHGSIKSGERWRGNENRVATERMFLQNLLRTTASGSYYKNTLVT